MTVYTILLDDAAARLYERVAAAAARPVEAVLSDALFKLAGELSFQSLAQRKTKTRLPPEDN